jgi:DNA primase
MDSAVMPKYLNSSESFIFDKSEQLFGLYQAKPFIREENAVLVVEGYTDALALSCCGIKNVVATCGTNITLRHIDQLKKITDKIILLYDGDNAGQTAMHKAHDMAIDQGIVLYGIWLESEDPQSFLWDDQAQEYKKASQEWLKEKIQNCTSILDYRLAELAKKSLLALQDSEQTFQLIQQMAQTLKNIKDPVSRKHREMNLVHRYRIPEALLQSAIHQALAQDKPKTQQLPELVLPKKTMNQIDESLLYAVIHGEEYLELLKEHTQAASLPLWSFFEDVCARKFIQIICQSPEQLLTFQQDPLMVATELKADEEICRVIRQSLALGPKCFSLSSLSNVILSRRKKITGKIVNAVIASSSFQQKEKTTKEALLEIEQVVKMMRTKNPNNAESKR